MVKGGGAREMLCELLRGLALLCLRERTALGAEMRAKLIAAQRDELGAIKG